MNQKQTSSEHQPKAAVYRGELSCDGCAESVATLLRNSPMKFKVHYLGPNEKEDINENSLTDDLDIFAWPGGGDDVDSDFKKVSHYTKPIQDFVRKGNHYLGICFGAYLARGQEKNETFFDLLPKGSYVAGERFEQNSQVKTEKDTIIETDWTFGSGKNQGKTIKDRWQYFQDGAEIYLSPEIINYSNILGKYSKTQNISAAIVPYGRGSVGLIGFHPEADQSWYDDYNIQNPQNVSHELGYDFIQTLYESRGDQVQTLISRNNDGDNQPFIKITIGGGGDDTNSASSLRFDLTKQNVFIALFVPFLALTLSFRLLKRQY